MTVMWQTLSVSKEAFSILSMSKMTAVGLVENLLLLGTLVCVYGREPALR